MIANLMAQIGNHTNMQLDENLLRHMILNSIRTIRSKFYAEYGELVIACDDKKYWRRDVFPYYKAHRKKAREASELDWNAIFSTLNKVREELKEFFPYKTIQVEGAEADDIIGTLCYKYGLELKPSECEKILILSGDKDFVQLQVFANVEQFDPIRKKWIKHSNPKSYLKEHIARGDRGDGVPNMLSKDDCLIVGRQKPLRRKVLDKILEGDMSDMTEEQLRNYNRNQMLVDLSFTPQEIRDNIIERYLNIDTNKRDKLFGYFVNHKLKNLMENIGDF
jgi:5'-3' exonuclease